MLIEMMFIQVYQVQDFLGESWKAYYLLIQLQKNGCLGNYTL